MWFRYSNVKNDIITITTNEDIINLSKNYSKEENTSKNENSADKIIIESKIVKKK